MIRLFTVLCSLLLVTTFAGTNIAAGDVNPIPSANQATPNAIPQPSMPGVQAPSVPAAPAQGPQVQPKPSNGQQPSLPAMTGAGVSIDSTCPPSSIAVDSNFVYVIQGNQIIKFGKTDMRALAVGTIPQMTMPGAQGAGPQPTAPAPTQPAGACVPAQPVQAYDPCVPCPPGSGPAITPTALVTSVNAQCVPVQGALPAVPSCAVGAGPSTTALRTDLVPRPEMLQISQNMAQLVPCDLDKAYLQMVLQMDAGATSWSNLARDKASRSDLRHFAGRAADADSQIDVKFAGWLHSWYGLSSRPYEEPTYLDNQVLNNLQLLSGCEFDIAYMQAMMAHYSELIIMSCDVMKRAAHSELATTAETISQRATVQLQQLRSWASSWYGINI